MNDHHPLPVCESDAAAPARPQEAPRVTDASEPAGSASDPTPSVARAPQAEYSRHAFLSGCNTRTLRLPMAEIEHWLVAHTTRNTIVRLLQGQATPGRSSTLVEHSRLLGLEVGGGISANGLLARFQITPETFTAAVEAAYQHDPLLPSIRPRYDASPETLLQKGRQNLDELQGLIAWVQAIDAGRPGPENRIHDRIEALKQTAGHQWRAALTDGAVRQAIELVGWHHRQPRGLVRVEELVSQIIAYCETEAQQAASAPALPPIIDEWNTLDAQWTTLNRQFQRERTSGWGRVRAFITLARQGTANPYQPATVQKVVRLLQRLNSSNSRSLYLGLLLNRVINDYRIT